MSSKLRCAVIGAGKMGMNHIRIYASLKNINFLAIAEINKKVGLKMAKQYSVSYYNDYQEMIKTQKLDIVSICVPSSSHFEVAKYCIEKKVNILLEKPIATSTHEGEELLRLAKKHRVKMLVGHIERFNPAVNKVKEIIKSGQLGKIISIIARRVGGFPYQIRDSNIMVDLAIHDIDVVNYLLEELPQVIYINKKRIHIKQREDSVEYLLKYKFTSAFIQTNWFTPVKIRKLNITGTKGYLEMDYISQQIDFFKSNYRKFKDTYKGFSDFILRFSETDKLTIPVKEKEPLREEIMYFIQAVSHNKPVDSRFAVNALQIALT